MWENSVVRSVLHLTADRKKEKITGQYKHKLGTQDSFIFLKKKHVCSYVYLYLSIIMCVHMHVCAYTTHTCYHASLTPHPSAPCHPHLRKNAMLQKQMKRSLWHSVLLMWKKEKKDWRKLIEPCFSYSIWKIYTEMEVGWLWLEGCPVCHMAVAGRMSSLP